MRTLPEYAIKHLDNSHRIPIDELEANISEVKKLTKNKLDRPIVVYCAKGGRAAKAKSILKKHGFTKVVNLGSIDDY